MGIFVLMIFGARVSGSHFNPAITLAFMFRKNTEKFSRPLGLAYIIAQVAGGFLGGLLAYFFTVPANSLGVNEDKHIPLAMLSEVIGAFFVTFLYLTQTEQKTKLSQDAGITTLIIAASYLAAMLMVSGPDDAFSPLNPALALGTMFQQVYHRQADAFKRIYIYIPFPLLGGLCAVVFHELIYRKVSETIQESEEAEGILDKEGDEEEDSIGIQK